MAKRVQDAIENNIRRWNVSGRLPLDPSDLSDTEAFLLAAHVVAPPSGLPDDIPSDPEPEGDKPMQKPTAPDISGYKPGEEIPLMDALAACEAEADPRDVDDIARATGPIIQHTIAQTRAWQPL